MTSHLIYIDHILNEIDFLQRKRKNKTEQDFAVDETMQRAFARSVEIIGEAVKNIERVIVMCIQELKDEKKKINLKHPEVIDIKNLEIAF